LRDRGGGGIARTAAAADWSAWPAAVTYWAQNTELRYSPAQSRSG